MKLIVCLFLVLVILEEYHCDPCLDFLFKGRHKNNDRGNVVHGHRHEHRRHSSHRRPSHHSHGHDHRAHETNLHLDHSIELGTHHHLSLGTKYRKIKNVAHRIKQRTHNFLRGIFTSSPVGEGIPPRTKFVVTPNGIREIPA